MSNDVMKMNDKTFVVGKAHNETLLYTDEMMENS